MKVQKKEKLSEKQKGEISEEITTFFERATPVLFVYIYGSFTKKIGFNDIDVAVYVDDRLILEDNLMQYQLDLGVKLEKVLKKYPIDCRIINKAPLSFRFSVITEGELLFSRDESRRISFETLTRSRYFDFKPHSDFYYEKVVMGK